MLFFNKVAGLGLHWLSAGSFSDVWITHLNHTIRSSHDQMFYKIFFLKNSQKICEIHWKTYKMDLFFQIYNLF